MKDQTSIQRIAQLHPDVREGFQNFITDAENALNITIRIVQGLRTFAEQDALYAQGRTKPGNIVTYSPAGTSYHNYGLAVDVVPIDETGKMNWNYDFKKLVPFAEKYGITWGGNFPHPDLDHFENKKGFNWRDLLHKRQINDFILGTDYVILLPLNAERKQL